VIEKYLDYYPRLSMYSKAELYVNYPETRHKVQLETAPLSLVRQIGDYARRRLLDTPLSGNHLQKTSEVLDQCRRVVLARIRKTAKC
jgi:hypothetical protein